MPWLSIMLELEAARAEPLSDALLELGADSVHMEYGDALARLSVLAAGDADAAMLIRSAAEAAGIPPPNFHASRVEDEDWVGRSQAQFAPIRISADLWIVPTWHAPPDAAARVLRLDPGLAFGTGSHATTRLVLRYLERNIRAGDRVLDYGCGSGILAIVAALLGAGETAATDIDPQALETTVANAAQNGVALRVAAPDRLPPGTFDLVLANILAGPLVALAPLFAERTHARGRIALSGILEAQAGEVAGAYARDFDVGVHSVDEGWALVTGVRR